MKINNKLDWGYFFLFLFYYCILPLILPLIAIGLFREEGFDKNFALIVTQTCFLFSMVNTFYNTGLLTSSKKEISEVFKGQEEKKHVYVAISLLVGISSIMFFVLSYTINFELKEGWLIYLFPISFLMTIVALYLYYNNPLVLYSGNNGDLIKKEKIQDVNQSIEDKILGE